MSYRLRSIGIVNGALTATAGTIACSTARRANFQVTLDSNDSYEVVVSPVRSATGTCSKNNCAGIVTNLGTYEGLKPTAGCNNWWLAYRVYNGATAAAGGASDKYALEKLG